MIYAVPMGVDFTDAVIEGFVARYPDPLELARIRIVTNSVRSATILREGFTRKSTLLPKIFEWQQFVQNFGGAVESTTSRVTHVLEVARLLKALAQRDGDALSEASVYELAYLLLELLEQSTERGLTPQDFVDYDASRFAEHWQRNAAFFQILADYWHNSALVDEARLDEQQRRAMQDYLNASDDDAPIYIVGSTGSRIAMRDVMRQVLAKENGALIMPAYDFDRPECLTPEHPQFGFQDLEAELGLPRASRWVDHVNASAAFVGAALAPAPATDEWLANRDELREQVSTNPLPLTVIQSQTQLDEVRALTALIHEKRKAGKTVALVTGDRSLVRRLLPRLEALNIAHEDSAGLQMSQTPSGSYAGLVLEAFDNGDAVTTIALLSHPFCAKLNERGQHLMHVRWFEERVLRQYSGQYIWQSALDHQDADKHREWLEAWQWILSPVEPKTMGAWVEWHLEKMAEISGVTDAQWGDLKGAEKGDLALFDAMQALLPLSDDGALVSLHEYGRFWRAWLGRARAVNLGRSGDDRVKILGSIEARTESADCVILASMNEGFWPASDVPDMWLNRAIRNELGLEVPERFVGLAAHDFIGAFSAGDIVLSRALNDDGAPTVESRFLTRLRVLWKGVGETGWKRVLDRGTHYDDLGRTLDEPESIDAPSARPAVRIPSDKRPKRASVTGLETLTKNGYKYYVQQVLRLRDLSPLGADLDAAAMGSLVHAVMERVHEAHSANRAITRVDYDQAMEEILAQSRLDDFAELNARSILSNFFDAFVPLDKEFAKWAEMILVEVDQMATFAIPNAQGDLTIKARIDRFDQAGGAWRVFDYKSGSSDPYGAKNYAYGRAVQLPLTAMILNDLFGDALDDIAVIRYKKDDPLSRPKDFSLDVFREEFEAFMQHVFAEDFAYAAVGMGARFDGPYAHLARYGEWLESDNPIAIEVDND